MSKTNINRDEFWNVLLDQTADMLNNAGTTAKDCRRVIMDAFDEAQLSQFRSDDKSKKLGLVTGGGELHKELVKLLWDYEDNLHLDELVEECATKVESLFQSYIQPTQEDK